MKKLILVMSSLLMTLSATAYTYPYSDFESPSGNIRCSGAKDYVICAIDETAGNPPISRRCNSKNLFILRGTGKTEIDCYDYIVFDPNAPTSILQYGQTIRDKNWQCTSTIDGMVCQNRQQRGFKLNRKELIFF